jgi:hypothetical protein
MLICDICLAKHELPCFGHPFGKIHHLKFLMLVQSRNIVHGSILLIGLGHRSDHRNCKPSIFSSIFLFLKMILLPESLYFPEVTGFLRRSRAVPAETCFCRHAGSIFPGNCRLLSVCGSAPDAYSSGL